jgi:type IV pilus assembly protein PilN
MRITINMATRIYLDHRRIRQVCRALAIMLAILLLLNGAHLVSRQMELRRIRSDITTYEGRLNARPKDIPEKEYTTLLATIAFYNGILERKAFNWLGLLERLEDATPDGIALTALVPDGKNGTLKIEGRAHAFAGVRAYLEKLEDSRQFVNVLLLTQSDITVGSKSRGVQFSLSCRAVPQ